MDYSLPSPVFEDGGVVDYPPFSGVETYQFPDPVGSLVVAHHCHRPIIVLDPSMPLGHVIGRLQAGGHRREDDVIDNDVVLLWGDQPRIITGADILGRLLRGIST